jgi:hypothetical protein
LTRTSRLPPACTIVSMAKQTQDHERDLDRLNQPPSPPPFLPFDSLAHSSSTRAVGQHHHWGPAAGNEQLPPITLAWAMSLARPHPDALCQARLPSLLPPMMVSKTGGRPCGRSALLDVIEMALETTSDDDDFDEAPSRVAAAPPQGSTTSPRRRNGGSRHTTSDDCLASPKQ